MIAAKKNAYLSASLLDNVTTTDNHLFFGTISCQVPSLFFGRKTNAKQLIDLNSVCDRNYMLSNFYGTQSFVKTYAEQKKQKENRSKERENERKQ